MQVAGEPNSERLSFVVAAQSDQRCLSMAWRYFSWLIIVEENFFTIANLWICDLVQSPRRTISKTAYTSHYCRPVACILPQVVLGRTSRARGRLESVIWNKISPTLPPPGHKNFPRAPVIYYHGHVPWRNFLPNAAAPEPIRLLGPSPCRARRPHSASRFG